MAVTIGVVQAALNSGTGTQDFTKSGFGTVKACLVIAKTEAGTAGISVSFGAATASTERWCTTFYSEDAQSKTDTGRACSTSKLYRVYDPQTNADGGSGDLDSFITDGIRLDLEVSRTDATTITVVLFGGADLDAHADTFTVNGTQGGTTDVTAPGFEPSVVIASCADIQADTAGNGWEYSLGFCHYDGVSAVVQRCIGDGVGDNAAKAACEQLYREDETVCQGGSNGWGVSLGSFDASGFTATTTRGTPGTSREVGYLALELTGHDAHVGTWGHVSGTGSQSYTAASFTPQTVMMLLPVNSTAATQDTTNGISSAFYVADEDGASGEANNWWWQEDNPNTSNCGGGANTTSILRDDNAGTIVFTAGFNSFNADGFTITANTNDDTADKLVLLIEESTLNQALTGTVASAATDAPTAGVTPGAAGLAGTVASAATDAPTAGITPGVAQLTGTVADVATDSPVAGLTITTNIAGTTADVATDAPAAGLTPGAVTLSGTVADVATDAPVAGITPGVVSLSGTVADVATDAPSAGVTSPVTVAGTVADAATDAPAAGITAPSPGLAGTPASAATDAPAAGLTAGGVALVGTVAIIVTDSPTGAVTSTVALLGTSASAATDSPAAGITALAPGGLPSLVVSAGLATEAAAFGALAAAVDLEASLAAEAALKARLEAESE